MEKELNDQSRLERIKETLSSLYWRWTILPGEPHPNSVNQLLQNNLPHLPIDSWARRFEIGGVYYNGKILLSDRQIDPPCKIEYYEPKFAIEDPAAFFPKFSPDQILYDQDGIMVIYKPPGIPAFQAKDQIFTNLRQQIESYVGHPVHMPSRLDTSVSGVVILSTDPATHQPLQRSFERREINKVYLLETHAEIPWNEKVVTLRIDKDPFHPILRRCVESGGQSACTHLKRVRRDAKLAYAKPITGRTHQIRLHASSSGFPIIGDTFYHGVPAQSLHLLSLQIQFIHPKSKKSIEMTLPSRLLPHWAKL